MGPIQGRGKSPSPISALNSYSSYVKRTWWTFSHIW